MSGQRNKKPSDVIKNRQDYLDNLSLQVQLNDANEQAVKQFVSTGQVPPISQMKDTRSTSDILLDVEKLKINLIKDLEPIADPQFAQQIVQRLIQSPLNIDNGLLVFTAQRIEEIVKNLKKLYKYGIKGDANDAEAFVDYINKMFVDKNKMTQSVKSFTNRMDKSTGGIGSTKSTDYYSSISSAFADYSSVYKSIVIANSKILDVYKPSRSTPTTSLYKLSRAESLQVLKDINQYNDELQNLNAIIRDKFKGLLGIIPEESKHAETQFYSRLEQIIIKLQGDPKYDLLSRQYERYLKFINHNIPNLSFSNHILTEMNNNIKNFQKVIASKNIQSIKNYYTTLINYMHSYDGLLDVDIDEIEEIEDIYTKLKKATNNFRANVETPGFEQPDIYAGMEPPIDQRYKYPQPLPPRGQLSLTDDTGEEGVGEEKEGEEGEDDAEGLIGEREQYLQLTRGNIDSLNKSQSLIRIRRNSKIISDIIEKEQGRMPGRMSLSYPSRAGGKTKNLLSEGVDLLAEAENLERTIGVKSSPDSETDRDLRLYHNLIQRQITYIKKVKDTFYPLPEPMRREGETRAQIQTAVRKNKYAITEYKKKGENRDARSSLPLYQLNARTPAFLDDMPLSELRDILQEQRQLMGRVMGVKGNGISKMSGRGLTRPDYTQGIEPSARYIKFGRYMINNKKLNDNVLSLRRSKGSTIATIPATKMTSELGNVIKKIVGGGVPSYDELNKLTDAEKKYLYKVSQEADIYDKIKIPTPCKDEEEKDIHAFNVMKGEIMAGNNSKELISKFKVLLNKLSRTNVLPKSQVREILEELLELGF